MLCMNVDIDNIQFTDDELYVLKKTWENLAEKNSGLGISQEVFNQYVQLNCLLQELLFSQFDIKKLSWIDYEDFMCNMNLLCFGSTQDHAKFLFEMCDIDKDGKIQKSFLSVLLHSIPFNIICENENEIDSYIDSIFGQNDSIICEDFKNWAFTVPKIMSYIKDHIPYNVENNLRRRQSIDKLDILPKTTENIEHESWLWKKCKRLGLLKKQYYYLHGSCLYYYNSKLDLKPQGIIYLVGSYITEHSPIRGMYTFQITQLDLCSGKHNTHESRIFCCESEINRNEWIKKLQDASHMHLFEDKYYLYTTEELGQGAYSKVYKCTKQDNIDVQYAVKIIKKNKFSNIEKEQFRAEINILKMINHPNIIKTYDVYETIDTIKIVTELINDGELFNYIINRPCFNDDELKPILKQLFVCISYLHDHAIVHSDIKPENILYNRFNGQIKLIDFGLSKILLPNKKIEQIGGTISYVAPEAFKLNMYCTGSDVWSVGVIMYLLVYGRLPFDPLPSEEVNEDITTLIMKNILTKELKYSETKSVFANNLLKKLLEKNPSQRISAKCALNDVFFNQNITCSTQFL